MKLLLPVVLALPLLLSACSSCSPTAVPVPADKAAYIGEWRAGNMMLSIDKDGNLKHGMQEKNGEIKILTVPMREFEGYNFQAGMFPMIHKFVVSAPPHYDDKSRTTKMTVDNVEYTKTQ